MGRHRLRVTNEIAAVIRRLHPQLKRKIKAALRAIVLDPDGGKVLRDELYGLRSFRVGNIRIIYRLPNDRYIEIVAIGPRSRIYEETLRLIKRDPSVPK